MPASYARLLRVYTEAACHGQAISCTATRTSLGARLCLSAPACRSNRCLTTWKAARPWTSSSASSRPSNATRRSRRSTSPALRCWLVRVLLDEQLPVDLAAALEGHSVDTVVYRGWTGITNGELLRRMGPNTMRSSRWIEHRVSAEPSDSVGRHSARPRAIQPHGASLTPCTRNS